MSSTPPHSGPSRDALAIMRYDAAKKQALIAYLLWFFLGYLGAHRFYLGRIGSAVGMLLLFLVSFALIYVVIGVLGYMILGLWWLIDAFLIPGIVGRHNAALIAQLQR